MSEIIAFIAGAVAVVSFPPVNAAAVRVRDWVVDVVSGPRE